MSHRIVSRRKPEFVFYLGNLSTHWQVDQFCGRALFFGLLFGQKPPSRPQVFAHFPAHANSWFSGRVNTKSKRFQGKLTFKTSRWVFPRKARAALATVLIDFDELFSSIQQISSQVFQANRQSPQIPLKLRNQNGRCIELMLCFTGETTIDGTRQNSISTFRRSPGVNRARYDRLPSGRGSEKAAGDSVHRISIRSW